MNEYYLRALQVFPNIENKLACLRGQRYWVKSKFGRFLCIDKRSCLLTFPSWEKEVKTAIRQRANDGLFLDVGANIGVLSVYAGNLGMEVIALEPDPVVCSVLKTNLKENGINGFAFNYAAWDGVCQLDFRRDTTNSALSKVDPAGEIRVYAITIDSLDLNPSIIKIDVEGACLQVLKGAAITLTKHHPTIIYEDWWENKAEIQGFLGYFGYTVKRLDRINCLAE